MVKKSKKKATARASAPTLSKDMADPEFRAAYVDATAESHICSQIRFTRKQRGLSVKALAALAGVSYKAIHHLEYAELDRVSLVTIGKVAAALDVAFMLQLMPFSQFAVDSAKLQIDQLEIPSFEEERKSKKLAVK